MLLEHLASATAALHTHVPAMVHGQVPAAAPPIVPNPSPSAVPGLSDVATKFIAWAKWGVGVAGMLGMLICAGMMILGRRNRSSTAVDGATGIPWVLGGLSVAAVAAMLVGSVL